MTAGKYTEVIAPNVRPIRIYGQSEVSSLQLYRARSILSFYLSDFDCEDEPCYGRDKAAVANAMADNGAILDMPNGAHEQPGAGQSLRGQELYAAETPVEGGDWYMDNNMEHRDAAFEEILHLVHDNGIGIDRPGYQAGALPQFQELIREATTANQPTWLTPPGNGNWGEDSRDWINELAGEGSLTQEYLASVIDSYYGLWELYGKGMWGIYKASKREELATIDPLGLEVVKRFFSPRLTWMVYLSPELSSGTTFQLDFDESPGANNPAHAYKSRYIDNVYLLGGNDSNLRGNANDNCFGVNAGDNTVDGGVGGLDVLMLRGSSSDYTVSQDGEEMTVTDRVEGRDGITRPLNIDVISYMDVAVLQNGDLEAGNYLDQVIKCWDLVGVDWTGSAPINSPSTSPTKRTKKTKAAKSKATKKATPRQERANPFRRVLES